MRLQRAGMTVLHTAARYCTADVVGVLLQQGADVDRRGGLQYTALHVAAR